MWIRLWKALLEPDNLRDAHAYVGGMLVAAGAGWWFRPAAGLVAFGVLLVYIGLVHTAPRRRH